jgi:hypothetical protein
LRNFKTKGFPHRMTGKVELPDMAELLLMPIVNSVFVEDARKYGTEFQKRLIDSTPFTNKKRYIYIQMQTSLLTPEVSPVVNINKNDYEWHVDGNDSFEYDDVVYHILQNKTTSMTDFNTTPFETEDREEDGASKVIRKMNDPESDISKLLVPLTVIPERIYTFDNTNIHRAKRTTRPEFRFFYRVVESDIPLRVDQRKVGRAYVYDGSTQSITNIEQIIRDGHVSRLDINKYIR